MIWVLVAVVVVVLLVIVGVLVARAQRSRKLEAEFGPEYSRVVAQRGDQRAAERELDNRRQRVETFEIRALDPAAREGYQEQWAAAQRYFVDKPVNAVDRADELVRRVMHDRGYPVDEDFEQRTADISVEHPAVVENYRAAHGISVRARNGQASTEQLRQAMVHFRALFDDLLAPGDAGTADGASTAVAHESGRGAVTQQTTRRS
jgi:signal transduction histidine kinase